MNRELTSEEGQVYVTTTVVSKSGHIHRETTLDVVPHRGPFGEASWETFNADGSPMRRVWHEYGIESRADGPAVIWYHKGTDRPKTEVYVIDGEPRPREDGPYMVILNPDGSCSGTKDYDPSDPLAFGPEPRLGLKPQF